MGKENHIVTFSIHGCNRNVNEFISFSLPVIEEQIKKKPS